MENRIDELEKIATNFAAKEVVTAALVRLVKTVAAISTSMVRLCVNVRACEITPINM